MPFRPTSKRLFATSIAASLLVISGWAAAAHLPEGSVQLVNTPGPGGPLGTNGFDVFVDQRVAARFTVPAGGPDMHFERAGVWLMNNSDNVQAQVVVSLQTDALDEGGDATLPSGNSLEHWVTRVKTYGWSPVQQFVFGHPDTAPLLKAGHSYWIVVASNAKPLQDPVWTFARKGLGWSTTSSGGVWQQAGEGGALTLRVDALPVDGAARVRLGN